LRKSGGSAQAAFLSLPRAPGARGQVTNGDAARRRKLAHAAGEIAQVQAQLIERKAEREDPNSRSEADRWMPRAADG
jgi:hypothetical protein